MSEGSRLSRWSQRKLAAKQTARHGGALPEPNRTAARADRPERALPRDDEQREPLGQAPVGEPVSAAPAPEQAEIEMLTEADLPPIEGLTAQSDYTVFLKNNVPEALRKAALRKLWVSDPVLANLDGLNDYCEDHHAIDMSMTLDDTSYKIGRGYDSGDEPEAPLEPETAPETSGEPAVARAEQDDSHDAEEHADAAAEEVSEAASHDGYSDAPPAAEPDDVPPAAGAATDKA